MKMFGEHRVPGRLFVVEGLDGSGKSTQLQLLKHWLDGEGYSVIESSWNSSRLVKETTSKAKKKQMFTPTTFSMLHATDFADRIERDILPPLQAGAIVLCDRYIYTAFARDAARGCNPKWVRDLYRFALKPNLAFYFRVPLDTACKRILGGRGGLKFYEAGMDLGLSTNIQESFRIFQGKIADQYEAMAEESGFVVIDATLPIEDQQEQVRRAVQEKLEDAKRIRVRRWVQLSPAVRAYRD